MRKLFFLVVLFVFPVTVTHALEANYRMNVRSILSTDNPDGQTIVVVAVANFDDAEDLISRATNGQLISFSFGFGRKQSTGEQSSLEISQNSLEESNIIFEPGQTQVIIGRIADGRIVAQYDAAESTFTIRYSRRIEQEGSTGTDFADDASITFLAEVEEGNVFNASSTVTVDFNANGSGEEEGAGEEEDEGTGGEETEG